MRRSLPSNPTKKIVIDMACEAGWVHRIIKGKDVLISNNGELHIILQDIGNFSFYEHTVASSYARRLGIDIEPEKGKSVCWQPSNDEST